MGYVFQWRSIKMMRFQKAVDAIVMLVAQPQCAAAQGFTKDDIPLMIETSRTNEIRFDRDYKGKPFSACCPSEEP